MDTVRDYFSKDDVILSLKKEIELLKAEHEIKLNKLKLKNSKLSEKCENFRDKTNWITRNRDNLKAKHRRTALVIAELYVDNELKLTIEELADRLFMTKGNISNIVAKLRKGKNK